MTAWTSDELAEIAATDEVEVAGLRQDGTLRGPRVVWAVRLGDDVYVRSVNGPTAAWYRGVQVRHEGRIEAGRVSKDVSFETVADDLNDEIDTAYRAKYHRYGGPVRAITAPAARTTTLRLVPRNRPVGTGG